MPTAPITHAVVLDAPPQRVFDLFCDLGAWWPLAYTFSEPDFAGATIERRRGGRWFERDTAGKELSWGEVRSFEEGRRLVLEFGIGLDRKPAPPGTSSEIEVRFLPVGGATRVEVEHRHFDRQGEGAQALRTGMDSRQGWPLLLAELRRAAQRR